MTVPTARHTRLAVGAVAAGGFWMLPPAPWYVGAALTALLLGAVWKTKFE